MLRDWNTEDVVAWLSSLQLERYAPAFRKYRVDGEKLAMGLSEKFMSAQLRINVRLHRLKIQQMASDLLREDKDSDAGEDRKDGRVIKQGTRRRKRRGQGSSNAGTISGRRAGSNNLAVSPHLRRRAPRDVFSAPAKIRPRNRQNGSAELRTESQSLDPRDRDCEAAISSADEQASEARDGLNDSVPAQTQPAAANRVQLQTCQRRVSSPVSSLRAKHTQSRYLGRRLGRAGGKASPRHMLGSPSSLRSSSLGSNTSAESSGSGTSRDQNSQAGDMRSTGNDLRTLCPGEGKEELSSRGNIDSAQTKWRPFSAPIGLATMQHRRRRSRGILFDNGVESNSSVDNGPPLTNGSQASRVSGYSSGGGSHGSRTSRQDQGLQAAFETAWTWKQLLESSDLGVADWLSKVSKSVNHGNDENGEWAGEVSNVSQQMHSEGYRTVRDLLEDVHEADFRADLQQWGLRKRFLNEVHHRLKDMSNAFEILAERPSPVGSSSKLSNSKSAFRRDSASAVSPEVVQKPNQQAALKRQGRLGVEPPFHIVGRDNKKRGKLQRPVGLSIVPPPVSGNTYVCKDDEHMLQRPRALEVSKDGSGHDYVDVDRAVEPVVAKPVESELDNTDASKGRSKGHNGHAQQRTKRQNPSINMSNILGDSNDAYGASSSMVMTPGGTVKYDGFTIAAEGVQSVPFSDLRNSWSKSSRGGDRNAAGLDEGTKDAGGIIRNERPGGKEEEGKVRSSSGQSIEDELIVLQKLGSGAGGVVHKAIHVPTMTVVAVKRIRLFDRSELRQMSKELKALYTCSAAVGGRSNRTKSRPYMPSVAEQETTAGSPAFPSSPQKGRTLSPLGQGECPHVVSYYDAFTSKTDATISIVLEFMDAGSLQDLINANVPMAECVVANIGYRILRGLQFIHSRRIIHRDIKPSNLLINRSGDVKISDFGIARKLQGTGAMSQTYLGTLMYMAPERINTNEYGRPADIWAVGLSLLTCAMGRFPFENKSGYWALTHAIAIADLPDLSYLELERGFSGEFRDFIQQCLRKNPDERPSASELLEHNIFRLYDCKNNVTTGKVETSSARETEACDVGLESSRASSLCQSLSESMIMASSVNGSVDGSSSASDERIKELETISEKVLRRLIRFNFVAGGPHGFREWGDPSAVQKLYLPPQKLKRLAKQLGLPSHIVIRKFDKKASQLLGLDGASVRASVSSTDSSVWESIDGGEPSIPFHMVEESNQRRSLKKPNEALSIDTQSLR